VSAKELDEIEKLLKELNPSAPIARTEYAKVDAASILGIGAFDVDKTLARDEGFLDFRPYRQHDSRIQSVTLRSEVSHDRTHRTRTTAHAPVGLD
jgi:G3E family GTPase